MVACRPTGAQNQSSGVWLNAVTLVRDGKLTPSIVLQGSRRVGESCTLAPARDDSCNDSQEVAEIMGDWIAATWWP